MLSLFQHGELGVHGGQLLRGAGEGGPCAGGAEAVVVAAGDEVDMDEDGNLTVNGALQTGEILYPTYAGEDGPAYPYTVPEGCVFLLGDYRTQTLDSRDFGAISMENVEGKVITLLRRRGL